ncbi:hypothetical protein ACFLS9_02325 [Bacteroidota bacterium]
MFSSELYAHSQQREVTEIWLIGFFSDYFTLAALITISGSQVIEKEEELEKFLESDKPEELSISGQISEEKKETEQVIEVIEPGSDLIFNKIGFSIFIGITILVLIIYFSVKYL